MENNITGRSNSIVKKLIVALHDSYAFANENRRIGTTPIRRIKRAIDGYFFGGTPPLASALIFYGFIVVCILAMIVACTANVLL